MDNLNKSFDKKFEHEDRGDDLVCDILIAGKEKCTCQLKEIKSFIRQREKELLDEACKIVDKWPFLQGKESLKQKIKELSNE